jgi:peptidyl-prolyl cis-trans isomerase D
MAIISDIRKRSGIIIGLIALALAGFLLMDMTSGNQSLFGGNDFTVGKVAGQKIDWKEFLQTEEILYQGSTADVYSRRAYLWSYFIEKAIIEKEAKTLGLSVSIPELKELEFGSNLSPVISSRFVNQATGQVDRENLNRIQEQIASNTMEAQLRPYWATQEKEIIKDRLQSKLSNMVSKAMYSPKWLADEDFKENNATFNFKFALVPYTAIPDGEAEVKDSDIDAYIKENAGQFKQTYETRKVDYIAFNVVPTAADSAVIMKELDDLIAPFIAAENDTTFLEANMGEMDGTYKKKADITGDFAESLFGIQNGDVLGPYVEGGFYKITKVLDRKMIPDSVRSRHILLPAANADEAMAAQVRLDSIKAEIMGGRATFEAMAMQFSQDGSASSGGDLGYIGLNGMVKNFNDMIFYKAEMNTLNTVFTEFGVHLVQVTDRKYTTKETGISLATIAREIAPSDATQNEVYEKAFDLASKYKTIADLKEGVKEIQGLIIATSEPLKENDYLIAAISPTTEVREIVRWAYADDREAGDLSGEVYAISNKDAFYTSKYVIAGLNSISPKGLPSAKDKRQELEAIVRNRVKAKLITEKIQGKTAAEVATMYNTQLQPVQEGSFNNTNLGDIGEEPAVVATAMGLGSGKTSKPIRGNAGVFVVTEVTANAVNEMMDDNMFRNSTQSFARRNYENNFMIKLTEKYDVKDKRYKFF